MRFRIVCLGEKGVRLSDETYDDAKLLLLALLQAHDDIKKKNGDLFRFVVTKLGV